MSNLPKTAQLTSLEGRGSLLLRLVELSVTLNSTLDLDELLQLITATAADLLDCEASSILLFDEKNPRLYFAAATGSDAGKVHDHPMSSRQSSIASSPAAGSKSEPTMATSGPSPASIATCPTIHSKRSSW